MMPIFCDEGVYHIVVDIMLNEPDAFHDLFPMLGNFHLTKVLLRCVGRVLTGSGIDDALIEAGVREKSFGFGFVWRALRSFVAWDVCCVRGH